MNAKNKAANVSKDPFAYIAFWQLMTFIILILLVWINELRDGAAIFFDAPRGEFSIYRGSILTIAVLIAAIITIGNTYLQEQRVMKALISVCSHCHRVRLNNDVWQKLEEYVGERSMLSFTHGICPDCTVELMKTIEKKQGAASGVTSLT